MATINWSEKKAAVVVSKPEIMKLEQELIAQKEYNVYLESTVLELADILLMTMM